MKETWLAQSYTIFVQNASANGDEIVRDCPLTLGTGAGTLVPMSMHLCYMLTTTMMTATPKRVAVASS